MAEQLRGAGTPGPKVIGIGQVSLRKRHIYRIVVSKLGREGPIWLGGEDRKAHFYPLVWEKIEKERRGKDGEK